MVSQRIDEELLPNGEEPSSLTTTPPDQAKAIADLMPVQPSSETQPSDRKRYLTPRKPGWRVVLGRTAWSRHTYERPEDDDLTLLGSVRKGAQVGALAVTAEGEYLQVVGEHLSPLKTNEIAKAVAHATRESNPEFSRETLPWIEAHEESPAPVVIVKKRRVAVMP
ncbi:MAG: hypothetical protein KJ614_01935 [Gammaproteobacteria bacterium]|uniref:hypothetical protein n=1 Tax=Rhodoferax sp. TaxID=50421 RepID=UPI001D5D2E8C|nr:hypothetical protein [Rhodoferax sp.]MBU3897684.1 hypothetical protein [Gammaproteobacteria bacterium]MBU3998726.1 hypothetical protein [Gammaproteobacteria bacterium]MBU4112179.1 hypothetical protein [Gammaproteobacteria bacterium]MBU4172338.1 hypothetical protein [Gammaproteobacteria bacterium]